MYGTGGTVAGAGLVGGAGGAAIGSGVSPAELARTGAPLLVLALLGIALLVGGFVLARAHLRAGEEGA
ncbi:MAG TPA: hypothetical protein VFU19_20095 [Iamia sp.]|nr:hypothetical protein [Iamia sp.]